MLNLTKKKKKEQKQKKIGEKDGKELYKSMNNVVYRKNLKA